MIITLVLSNLTGIYTNTQLKKTLYYLNMNKEKCNHIWSKIGLWDGRSVNVGGINKGGIRVVCLNCGEKMNLTHEEWKNTPKNNKQA